MEFLRLVASFVATYCRSSRVDPIKVFDHQSPCHKWNKTLTEKIEACKIKTCTRRDPDTNPKLTNKPLEDVIEGVHEEEG